MSKSQIYKQIKTLVNQTGVGVAPDWTGLTIKNAIATRDRLLERKKSVSDVLVKNRDLKKATLSQLWALYKESPKYGKPNSLKYGGKGLKDKLIKELSQATIQQDDLTSDMIKTIKSHKSSLTKKLLALNNLLRTRNNKILLPIRNDIEKIFKELTVDGKYVLSFTVDEGEQHLRTISETYYLSLVEWLLQDSMEIERIKGGSGNMNLIDFSKVENLKIEKLKIRKHKKLFREQKGNYFKYYNMATDIDLSEEEIFNKQQFLNTVITENCFISVLIKSKLLSESDINSIKISYPSSTFSKKHIKNISKTFDIQFNLSCYANNRIRTDKIGKGSRTINLNLFQEHYFISRDVECTLYYIKNYNEINSIVTKEHHLYETRHHINRKRNGNYETKKELYNNLKIITNLFNNKLFTQDGEMLAHNNFRIETDEYCLDNIEAEQELDEQVRDPKGNEVITHKDRNFIKFYADFETDTTQGLHIPTMSQFMSELDTDVKVSTTQPVYTMLKYIQKTIEGYNKHQLDTYLAMGYAIVDAKKMFKKIKKAQLYFHNAKYDFSVMKPYLMNVSSICRKNGAFYACKFNYFGINIEIKDSLKIIPTALKNIPKMFNLPTQYHKNEAIAYEYHTLERINNQYETLSEYKKYLNPSLHESFHTILETGSIQCNYDKESQTFNPYKYYADYGRLDVMILKLGMDAVNKELKTLSNGRTTDDYLTISRIALDTVKTTIDSVWKTKGNLRKFISGAIYGGRVYANPLYIKKEITQPLSDFDACSMYPSAMIRICRQYGFPTKEWERIGDWSQTKSNPEQYYVVKIKITKIGKQIQIPVVCVKTDKGSDYINEVRSEQGFEIVTVDRITLEDMIKFQEIEYEFIEGVTVSLKDANKELGPKIMDLYKERLKIKKSNPAMGEMIKLILNSIYGKTCPKQYFSKEVVVKQEELENYIHKNFHNIINIEKISEHSSIVEIFNPDSSSSYNIIGCMILSMSKRIMNEVFEICDFSDFPVYYTDTDSIQLNKKDIPTIQQLYKCKYGTELIGDMPEQFHSDFKLKGSDGKPIDPENVISTRAIFLGKKCYINQLQGIDEFGVKCTGLHYRMKGISDVGLVNHCNTKYVKSKLPIYECYLNLTKDKSEEIITLNYDNYHPSFEFVSTGVKFRDVGSFTRTIKF